MKTSIIKKVKKLLAKAGSTDSPQEAESLFVAAQKLMVKHRIQQADLADDKQEIEPDSIACFEYRLEGNWELKLARVIAKANCCDFVYGKYASKHLSKETLQEYNIITFYGVEQDVQLVKYLFETTRSTFRRISKKEYIRIHKEGSNEPKNRFIRSFLLGACHGLSQKISKMTADHIVETNATGYELAVRNALQKSKDYIRNNVNTKSTKSTSSTGSIEGFNSGVKTGKTHIMTMPVEHHHSTPGAQKLNLN